MKRWLTCYKVTFLIIVGSFKIRSTRTLPDLVYIYTDIIHVSKYSPLTQPAGAMLPDSRRTQVISCPLGTHQKVDFLSPPDPWLLFSQTARSAHVHTAIQYCSWADTYYLMKKCCNYFAEGLPCMPCLYIYGSLQVHCMCFITKFCYYYQL